MDSTPHADIGEIGYGDYIEDAPDVVCRFAFEREAELVADPGVSTVGAEHIFRFDDFGLVGFAGD